MRLTASCLMYRVLSHIICTLYCLKLYVHSIATHHVYIVYCYILCQMCCLTLYTLYCSVCMPVCVCACMRTCTGVCVFVCACLLFNFQQQMYIVVLYIRCELYSSYQFNSILFYIIHEQNSASYHNRTPSLLI